MKDKKAGTLDDLIAAAVPLVVADEAEALLFQPVIDVQTGTELTPGDPERCAGNGKADPMACCCDGCDYYLACYPDAMPEDDEDEAMLAAAYAEMAEIEKALEIKDGERLMNELDRIENKYHGIDHQYH